MTVFVIEAIVLCVLFHLVIWLQARKMTRRSCHFRKTIKLFYEGRPKLGRLFVFA